MTIPETSLDPRGAFGIAQPRAKEEMGLETFLQLLTVQLSTQNPLEPMNDRDFFAQLAQLGTVQGLQTMKQGLAENGDTLLATHDTLQRTQAAGMIGKTATAIVLKPDGTTETITGQVKRVSYEGGIYQVGIQLPDRVVDVSLRQIQRLETQ